MRRLVSISLIALIMLNVFGFYVAFMLKTNTIRKEMAELTSTGNKENFKKLSFSKAEFQRLDWSVKNKEFRLNGRLTDVAKIEISDNGVSVYVLEDMAENDLVDNFTAIMQQRSDKDESNSPIKILLEHFLKEFTLNESVPVRFPALADMPSPLSAVDSYFDSFVSELQSPPPQSV